MFPRCQCPDPVWGWLSELESGCLFKNKDSSVPGSPEPQVCHELGVGGTTEQALVPFFEWGDGGSRRQTGWLNWEKEEMGNRKRENASVGPRVGGTWQGPS